MQSAAAAAQLGRGCDGKIAALASEARAVFFRRQGGTKTPTRAYPKESRATEAIVSRIPRSPGITRHSDVCARIRKPNRASPKDRS
jgi:hypothetical protein